MVFAVALAVITYIDRVAISWAAPYIQHDLNLDSAQMGWVFAAFTWAYAIFEIPGGFLGDWIGPRKVLIRVVLWWSFFTAATGWARGLNHAHRYAIPVRRGRSRVLSQHHQNIFRVAARQGKSARRRALCGWPRDGAARSLRLWSVS